MTRRFRHLIGTAAVLVLIASFAAVGTTAYDYYRTATPCADYAIASRHDDTLRILLLGDSWAFYHERHECHLATRLEEQLGRPVTVASIGFCGARSKTIYQRMFREGQPSYKAALLQKPDYCVVMAGVNDCYTKTGASAYQRNMELIASFLLSHHMRPVIMEIPDFDIYGAYRRQTLTKKWLRQLSMAVSGDSMNCIPAYREALSSLIRERNWQDSLIHLRSSDWHDQYSLYKSDCLHLNDQGYEVLDSCLSALILKDLGL